MLPSSVVLQPCSEDRRIASVARYAWYLLTRRTGGKGKRSPLPPVVFDIDDTLLRPKRNNVPIKPVLWLYQQCVRSGYPVYIVTARPDFKENVDATLKTLKQLGIKGSKDVLFMPERDPDVWEYKWGARKDIARREGMDVAMTVGDQAWDVLPGRAARDCSDAVMRGGIVHHKHVPLQMGVLVPES